jgi:diacylglycerol kinase family enzyme
MRRSTTEELTMTEVRSGLESMAARRWMARLAFLAAGAAAGLLLIVAGLRASVLLVLVGVGGMAVALVGVWGVLTHRGLLRWLAACVVLLAPVAVAVMYARADLVWVVTVFVVLWAAMLGAGRSALRDSSAATSPVEYETAPPRRPYLIMNPRSGGGKVVRFRLAERARELSAEVALLTGPATEDVADLARRAVRNGADLLGVAGGDGTQAQVAGVAAELGVPFMVISAGTRNHFALDLGLARDDPVACLDALTDGVEVRVDLGRLGARPFVNNASFGAYAAVVQSPAYRDDKTGTMLDMLPDLLAQGRGPALRLRVRDTVVNGPQAILISNNPYASDDLAGLGRRHGLSGGRLGVLAVSVRGAADAAGLLRGRRSGALTVLDADEVVVESEAEFVPVGIDGEAVTVPTPVSCTIAPGALRVRVPRHRPGPVPVHPEMNWRRLRRLALS